MGNPHPGNVGSTHARHRVLIIEDEQDIAGLIKHTLERHAEVEADIVGSGDAALKAVNTASARSTRCRSR